MKEETPKFKSESIFSDGGNTGKVPHQTKNSSRLGMYIWVIVIILVIGSLGSIPFILRSNERTLERYRQQYEEEEAKKKQVGKHDSNFIPEDWGNPEAKLVIVIRAANREMFFPENKQKIALAAVYAKPSEVLFKQIIDSRLAGTEILINDQKIVEVPQEDGSQQSIMLIDCKEEEFVTAINAAHRQVYGAQYNPLEVEIPEEIMARRRKTIESWSTPIIPDTQEAKDELEKTYKENGVEGKNPMVLPQFQLNIGDKDKK